MLSRYGELVMKFLFEFSTPRRSTSSKHVVQGLKDRGHQVLILSRDKDVMLPLLDALELRHRCLSRARTTLVGLLWELLIRELRALSLVGLYKPDLILAAHSVAAVHAGWLWRIPRVVHDDTEHARLQTALYMPFANHVVTSTAYRADLGRRQRRINSLEPLAYLHPDHFTPDPDVPRSYGIDPDAPYAVVRFVSWRAAHDIGLVGLSADAKRQVITELVRLGAKKIVLSDEASRKAGGSEIVVPKPEHFHHLLAFARLCVTEGGSVANEAAVLGTPTIYTNPLPAGLTDELERYGLLVRVRAENDLLGAMARVWNDPSVLERCSEARARLLRDKVNMARAIEDLLIEIAESRLTS